MTACCELVIPHEAAPTPVFGAYDEPSMAMRWASTPTNTVVKISCARSQPALNLTVAEAGIVGEAPGLVAVADKHTH